MIQTHPIDFNASLSAVGKLTQTLIDWELNTQNPAFLLASGAVLIVIGLMLIMKKPQAPSITKDATLVDRNSNKKVHYFRSRKYKLPAWLPFHFRSLRHLDLDILLEAGDRALMSEDLAAAEQLYLRILEVADHPTSRKAKAGALGNLGAIAITRGDLERAEGYQRQALSLNSSVGSIRGQAAAYANLGMIAFVRGDLEAAEHHQLDARIRFEELGDTEAIANSWMNLGEVKRAMGDLRFGDFYLREALKHFEAIGNEGGIANTMINLGAIAFQNGDSASARAHWEKALTMYNAIGAETTKNAQIARDNLRNLGPI